MSMADLISERRKEKGMTQKQLADKLGVTDKAVSKWERGNGYPDISYLEPLAEALEVTVSELLKGKTEELVNNDNDELMVKKTLDYATDVYKAKGKNAPRIVAFILFALGLLGIITTTIVDFALNRSFTWSLLPISAIVFSWLCVIPVLLFKKHRVNFVLLSVSLFLFPFLFVINKIVGSNWFVSVGIPISIVGIVILWLIRTVFATKLNIWSKFALSMLIGAIGNIVIAFMLGKILSGEGFSVWNLMSVAILVVTAIIFFTIAYIRKTSKVY